MFRTAEPLAAQRIQIDGKKVLEANKQSQLSRSVTSKKVALSDSNSRQSLPEKKQGLEASAQTNFPAIFLDGEETL